MAASQHVYIVDDDEAIRDALEAFLDGSGFAVQSFASAAAFLDAAGSLAHGCVLMDVRMPGMDGLQLQEELARRGLRFSVIVMTGHGEVALAVRAMKAGAADFLEKPFDNDMLLESIRSALARAEPDAAASEASRRLAHLSVRERQVLEGLVAGLPNKTIAYDLEISPRTVEIYRARLMDKMEAKTLAELVRLAVAAGVEPKGRR
jgi:two-component system response regulator FixJ